MLNAIAYYMTCYGLLTAVSCAAFFIPSAAFKNADRSSRSAFYKSLGYAAILPILSDLGTVSFLSGLALYAVV